MNIEHLVLTVREAEERMTADERQEFWALIHQGYCEHCGDKDPDGKCTCWNDE